jgi:membrane-bound lytic murein transglycosylase D
VRTSVINRTQIKIAIGILFFMVSTPSLAQLDRLQKLGVTLDQSSELKVEFWKKIYTDYSSHDYVIHDPKDLTLVLGVAHGEKELAEKKAKLRSQGIKDSQMRVQSGQKDRLEDADEASRNYLPRMEELLAEEKVPEELARLPFVESSFNREAKSKVGATGIWQFMPKTASRDLRVTDAIDERYDPLKATRAAARFLRRNHDQFKSWALAVMAYNGGPGLVQRAIQKLHTRDPLKIVNEFKDPNFQFASRNYLFEFLAMVDVGHKLDGKLPTFITISFPFKVKMSPMLAFYHLDTATTRILNPHFRNPIWSNTASIPAHYPIRLSGITLEEFRKLQYPKTQ